MKTMRRFLVVVCLLYVIVYSGCGYTTRAYVGAYQKIYVAPFKNSIDIASARSEYSRYVTYYPLLESTITQAVVNRFLFDGSLKIVKESDADVLLKGELISYNRGAMRYAENNEDVTQYRITLVVNISLYDTKTGELVWQKDSFAGDANYQTTGTQAKSEKAALDDAISDLARRIVDQFLEEW